MHVGPHGMPGRHGRLAKLACSIVAELLILLSSCRCRWEPQRRPLLLMAQARVAPFAAEQDGWLGKEPGLRSDLLNWYARNRRRLPWRGDPAPWSEDKAALRREAAQAASAAAHQQPKLTSFFTTSLKTGKPGAKPVVVDLDDSDEQPESASEGSGPAIYSRSAYGTWVSEVMLQQTQVERVVNYWTRWMDRWPDVHALAQAEPADVNAAWAGLGFYGRARRLHAGAKFVVTNHSGNVPDACSKLLQIPGVGPYTAGAISSIAFGQRAAVVDGNVIRVFARLLALPGDSASPVLLKRCWALAEDLVDPASPGSFNQALMELGATVCTPQAPACAHCPMQHSCKAFELLAAKKIEAVTKFPARAVKKQKRVRCLALAAMKNQNGAWLLARRPSTGLLANQLELPSVELEDHSLDAPGTQEPIEEAGRKKKKGTMLPSLTDEMTSQAKAALQTLLGSLISLPAGQITSLDIRHCGLAPVEHLFSHERHYMHLFSLAADGPLDLLPNPPRDASVYWMTPAEAEATGATSGLLKVFSALKSLDARNQLDESSPPAKRGRKNPRTISYE